MTKSQKTASYTLRIVGYLICSGLAAAMTWYAIDKAKGFHDDLNTEWVQILLGAHAFDFLFLQNIKIALIFLYSKTIVLNKSPKYFYVFPCTIFHTYENPDANQRWYTKK